VRAAAAADVYGERLHVVLGLPPPSEAPSLETAFFFGESGESGGSGGAGNAMGAKRSAGSAGSAEATATGGLRSARGAEAEAAAAAAAAAAEAFWAAAARAPIPTKAAASGLAAAREFLGVDKGSAAALHLRASGPAFAKAVDEALGLDGGSGGEGGGAGFGEKNGGILSAECVKTPFFLLVPWVSAYPACY